MNENLNKWLLHGDGSRMIEKMQKLKDDLYELSQMLELLSSKIENSQAALLSDEVAEILAKIKRNLQK